jgi:hypothetical protein
MRHTERQIAERRTGLPVYFLGKDAEVVDVA